MQFISQEGSSLFVRIGCFFKNMDKTLFETIKTCRDQKRARRVFPDYVPVHVIPSRDRQRLRDALNLAQEEGYVKIHRGINYDLIELMKDEYNE